MYEPLVSVIVTAYNVEEYIEECILSIHNQTYTNFEVIIVDDGSTDLTANKLELFVAGDDRIHLIQKENGGHTAARKAGLKCAKGEFVTYVDGDDWVDANYLKKMVDLIQLEDNIDIVACGITVENKISKKAYNGIPSGIYDKENLERIIYPRMLSYTDWPLNYGVFPYLCDKLIRKSILIGNQMSVPDFIVKGEDVLGTYPTILDANKMVISDSCDYHYRRWKGSITMSLKESENDLRKRHVCLKNIFQKYPQYNDILLPQYLTYLWHNLTQQIYEELFYKDEFLPFGIKKNERVVLYGMGENCKRLENILKDFCQIIAYSDRNALSRLNEKENIVCANQICELDYDKIVITIVDVSAQNDALEFLVAMGNDINKIMVERKPHEIKKELLEMF